VAAELAAFLGISALVIATPGQDTVLTIRNTLAGGRTAGAFTAVGVASGQALWTIAASAGVAALILASDVAFTTVKLAGAAYLVYLGAQSLRSAFASESHAAVPAGDRRRIAPLSAFGQGVISNLGNPKMAVFFTSLLPQFAPGGGSFLALLALGLVFCLMTLAWLTGYALAVARAGDFLRRPRVRRALDAATGAVLVALGLRVATERR
jgi:threonine/homoserine/homoserine lactone efflux protein